MSLLKSLQLGPYTLKNRVFLSALTRDRATPGTVPNELMRTYYEQRSGGGLLVTEGVLIVQQGSAAPCLLLVHTDHPPVLNGLMPLASGTRSRLRAGKKSQMLSMQLAVLSLLNFGT